MCERSGPLIVFLPGFNAVPSSIPRCYRVSSTSTSGQTILCKMRMSCPSRIPTASLTAEEKPR